MRILVSLLCIGFLSACVSPVKVITELDENNKGNINIQGVNVIYSDLTTENLMALDAKAKVAGEKSSDPTAIKYQPLKYALKKIATDRLEQRDTDGSLLANITIEVDNLKLANPAMAVLLGDSDQLTGSVQVVNAQSQEILTEFQADVLKATGGLLGLAIRGGGVREKLSLQFSDHIGDQLGFDKVTN